MKNKDNSRFIPSVIITCLLVVALILRYIEFDILSIISVALFICGHLFAIVYASVSKSLKQREKLIILIISVFPLIFYLFMINHWPGASIIQFLMFIPAGTFIYSTFQMKNILKYEIPFLGIIAVNILLMIF